jgi:hypothetical protein
VRSEAERRDIYVGKEKKDSVVRKEEGRRTAKEDRRRMEFQRRETPSTGVER